MCVFCVKLYKTNTISDTSIMANKQTPFLELTIIADTNDADYVHSITIVTQETLDHFMPVIEAIKANKSRHNWDTSDCGDGPNPVDMYAYIDEDLIEEFDEEFIPYGEHGIHTIDTIKVRKLIVVEETDFLKS